MSRLYGDAARRLSERIRPPLYTFPASRTAKCAFTCRLFSSSLSRHHRTPQQIKDDHNYCVQLVHDRDREAWLCGLLLPSDAQPAYFAVRAFNAEIATIKDPYRSGAAHQQSPLEFSTLLAWQIRLQWWREAVATIYSDDSSEQSPEDPHDASTASSSTGSNCWQSPVIRQLDACAHDFLLTRRWFDRLVDARMDDLARKQFATMEEAVDYADDTVTSMLFLTMEILQCLEEKDQRTASLGEDYEEAAEACLSHAGIGIGLTTLLRGLPVRIFHGECSLPQVLFPPQFAWGDWMMQARHDDHDENSNTPRLSEADAAIVDEAVKYVAHEATLNLQRVRSLQSQVPKPLRLSFLPVVPSSVYLERLEKANYNVTDPTVIHDPTRLKLMLLLARTWMTGVL